MLVLGGTGFIGRHFVDAALKRSDFKLTILSRGSRLELFAGVERIACDRENFQRCQSCLRERHFDRVVDFSGTNFSRVLNTVSSVQTDHYTFLSTSAVDLATRGDPYLEMAKEKLWCEHAIAKAFDTVAVRAGFVVGDHDSSDRFEQRKGQWFWKDTDRPVHPLVTARMLASTLYTLSFYQFCGVVRGGYE